MRKAILVVESDLDLRETLLELLANAGFDVVLAAGAREALDALLTGRAISLILLDPRMPMLDILEFRRRQMDNPALAKVPLVILSGEPGGAEETESPDFSPVLKMPFGQDTLLQLVFRYCGEAPSS